MRDHKNPDVSAATAAAEIGEQLDRLRRNPKRDPVKLELAFRDAYNTLWASSLIQGDSEARTIMLRIARARTITQLERQVGALARRVDEFDRRRNPDRPKTRKQIKVGAPAPRPLESRADPYAEQAPRRTFIAL